MITFVHSGQPNDTAITVFRSVSPDPWKCSFVGVIRVQSTCMMFVIDKICPKRIADAFRWSSAIQTYPRQYFATSGSWSKKMLWKLLRLVILPWFCKANALAKCQNRTHWNGNRLSREIWRFRKVNFLKRIFFVEHIGYDEKKTLHEKISTGSPYLAGQTF